MNRICLIEDDVYVGTPLSERLEMEGHACDWFQTGEEARKALLSREYALVISDIRLPDVTGDSLFQDLLRASSSLPPFIFMTGYGAIDQAVALLKLGAQDYVTKPFDLGELMAKVKQLCLQRPPTGQLGISAAMRHIEALFLRLSTSRSPVLITGESGVGKEEVARRLHRAGSDGASRPFVAVNCGAIPENLLEAELFGHEKGAFTGAVRARSGVFEQADGGTLFLDEVGEMPTSMQVKLLRVIEDHAVLPVGATQTRPVTIRLVCATHRDLRAMVEAGEFREDLYYRIHVIHVVVPPLRERREDILWLADRFLYDLGRATSKAFTLSARAREALLGYPWPGNVRELRHCLERASVLSAGPCFETEAIFGTTGVIGEGGGDDGGRRGLEDYLQVCERDYIQRVLAECDGRVGDSANALGISRKSLWQKMKKLGVRANADESTPDPR